MKTIKQSLGKVSITVEKEYWDNKRAYDRLVIVESSRGRTYISRKPVPIGRDINDREYWIPFVTLPEEFIHDWNAIYSYYQNLSEKLDNYLTNFDERINLLGTELNGRILDLAIRVTNLENGGSHPAPTGETDRPVLTETDAGYQHYDIELNIPIWWTGTKWVDAMGNDVTNYSD